MPTLLLLLLPLVLLLRWQPGTAGAVLDCMDPNTGIRAKYALIAQADSYDRETMCPDGPNQQYPLKNFLLRGYLEVRP
jgi:hypothetical protein